MFEKILVPVDGSETSWRALAEAKELAEAFKGELLVVNVIQPYNNSAMLVVPLDQATISQGNEELTKIGNSVLDTAKEKLKDFKGKAEFDLEVGHPSERVLAVCKEKKCTAIVIGSRGLSGIAEFFLGSVSSKVSQYADVPVLIVKLREYKLLQRRSLYDQQNPGSCRRFEDCAPCPGICHGDRRQIRVGNHCHQYRCAL